jgi:hypothetical protein
MHSRTGETRQDGHVQPSDDELLGVLEEESVPGHELYVEIPEALEPVDRYKKYEQPIDAELDAQGLGGVLGGGTMTEGGAVAYSEIDLVATDLEKAVEVVRTLLRKLEAPMGTTIRIIGEGDADQSIPVWE